MLNILLQSVTSHDAHALGARVIQGMVFGGSHTLVLPEVNFEQERNATVLLCLFYEIRKNRKRLPSLPSLAKQTHGCLAATRGPGRRLW